MKNAAIFIFSFLLVGFSAKASSGSLDKNYNNRYDGSSYTFVEGNIEFSVFPDGQFDFVYVGPQTGSQVTISTPNVNMSFNSGYNYDAYIQYDDYGAVIQVENVPIYYDEYGRITQAGNVDIQYNNRRVVQVGGLHVIYNNYGYFSYCTGAINIYNPYYVYRPWHVYYARPIYSHCVVYNLPYRRYYNPVRYSYHDHILYHKNRNRVAYHNTRRDFYRPGSRVYDKRGRASINKNYNQNRTNTKIAQNSRNNNSYTRNSRTSSQNRTNTMIAQNSRSNNSYTKNNRASSKGAAVTRNSNTNRSNTVSHYNRSSNNTRTISTSNRRNALQTKTNRNVISNSKRNTTTPKRETTVRRNTNRRV